MDTRSTILNAAVQVFSQHGFRGSTTRRIADAASVNEVTIFRYFGSKEALIQEAIKGSEGNAFSSPLPQDPVDPLDELTKWCTAVITHLRDRGPMMRKCMSEIEERPELMGHASEAPTRATNELGAYLRKLKAKGLTHDDFDANAAATMLIGSLFHDAMGRKLMPDLFPKPANKAPGKYAKLILRSIGVSVPVTASSRSDHEKNVAE
jgi:AcrR family transcriptional regulator